ncbi:MAG: asparagine synthase (glutamine-hydrolyzing) [Bacteroidia bacterium]|nr:asparagine synthase (glutamine-hydrolyzing) [Bacteroidia bacterium]
MCGIAGYIGKQNIAEDHIRRTLHLMKNRGPDNQEYVSFIEEGMNVYLLHSRLSIIDLNKRSNQPYSIGDYTVIYNGEIYNYLELRKELEEKDNIRFTTESDMEVLLQCFIKYGEKCVDHFEGMWSFAIYDKKNYKLMLSRDRFAEKPLYYFATKHGIYFGSEIKFLRSLSNTQFKINQNHLLKYLVNGYKALYKTDDTYFDEIHELKYAENCIISKNLDKKIYRYWQPQIKPQKMSVAEAIEGTRYYLIESMKIRLRSDVPLAFCLSGGVDSASLASIAAKEFNYNVASFSIIDSDERYNEYDNMKATIDDISCKSTMVELSTDNSLSKLKDLINYHGCPVATITYFIHSFLSELIHKNGYKVAFSGTSADELFTGYYDHFNLHLYGVRNHPDYKDYLNDWQNHIGKFIRNPSLKNPKLYFDDPTIRDHIYLNNDIFKSYLKVNFNDDFIEEKFCDSLLRNRMLNELFHEATPVILHEDDLNSMKYSIENRSPYLDTKLFEFANSIPEEILIQKGYGKYILRESMKGILNDKVRLDRQKKGFNASINSIIDFSKEENREYLLSESPVFDLVKREKIIEVMDKPDMPNSFKKFLFSFINTKIFLEENNGI